MVHCDSWSRDDLEEIFDASEDFFNDDLGGNDTISSATPLRSVFGFENSTRYEAIGSISVRVAIKTFFQCHLTKPGNDRCHVRGYPIARRRWS